MTRKSAKNRQMPPKKRGFYTPDPVRSRIIARSIGGQSNREIATEEGIDRDTVSRVLSQDEVVEMKNSYRSRLLEMVPQAISVYEQLLNSKDERVRATAATKLLEGLQVFPKGGVWPEQSVAEQDHEQRKRLLLGRMMEMMLYKGQRYGIPLPVEFDELKSADRSANAKQKQVRKGLP
jgi:ribosomal protein S13